MGGFTPRQLFDRLDVDRNGVLSRVGLEKAVRGFQPDLTLTERDAVWDLLDTDNSGFIDLHEFRKRLAAINAVPLLALEEKIAQLQRTFTECGYGTCESFQ